MAASYPVSDVPPAYDAADASVVTPGGDASVATPGGDASVCTPGATAPAPVDFGGKKLYFIGVRNAAICREMVPGKPNESTELWRHELGKSGFGLDNNTQIAYCSGVVVARNDHALAGLDPLTGAPRWEMKLPEDCMFSFGIMNVSGTTVYVGCRTVVHAVNVITGKLLWSYAIKPKSSLPIVRVGINTIVLCGANIFVFGGSRYALVDAATGKERWSFDCESILFNRPPTGAWDGKNRVMLGCNGKIYRVDLRDGHEDPTLCLKDSGLFPVNLMYDQKTSHFYAVTHKFIYAITDGDDNKLVWKCNIPDCFFNSFAMDPESGRFYIVCYQCISCVHEGKLLFSKPFKAVSKRLRAFYNIVLDLKDSGRVIVGAGGYVITFDSDGNTLESVELKKLRHGPAFVCTPNATLDYNASSDVYQLFHARCRPRGGLMAQ